MGPSASRRAPGRVRSHGVGPVPVRARLLAASVTLVALPVLVAVAGTQPSGVASVTTAPPRAVGAPTGAARSSTAPPAATALPTTTTTTPAAPVTTTPAAVAREAFGTVTTPVVRSSGVAPAATAPEPVTDSSGAGSSVDYASTAPAPPSANIPADPSFSVSCRTPDDQSGCLAGAVLAFDNARTQEGVGPMVLPSDFAQLTPPEQLFVLVDSERVDRGLTPIAGELTSLDQLASGAAEDDEDPSVPDGGLTGLTVEGWVSNWASTVNDLSAVYTWMYDDGLGSDNVDCTLSDESGCWDHRDNILGFQNDVDRFGGSLSFGGASLPTGTAHGQSLVSATTLTTWSPDTTTGYYFTWDQAVADGAG